MRHFALSVIGRDRPGIVAAVSRCLLEHGANIEDSQSSILRGHFAMTLVVTAPADVDAARLRGDLEGTATELRLAAVTLSELDEADVPPAPASHAVTVYGADHPGIVNALATALAGCGVNITDLDTRLVDEPGGQDLSATMVEVSLPPGLSPRSLEDLLEATRREHRLELRVRELDPGTA